MHWDFTGKFLHFVPNQCRLCTHKESVRKADKAGERPLHHASYCQVISWIRLDFAHSSARLPIMIRNLYAWSQCKGYNLTHFNTPLPLKYTQCRRLKGRQPAKFQDFEVYSPHEKYRLRLSNTARQSEVTSVQSGSLAFLLSVCRVDCCVVGF